MQFLRNFCFTRLLVLEKLIQFFERGSFCDPPIATRSVGGITGRKFMIIDHDWFKIIFPISL